MFAMPDVTFSIGNRSYTLRCASGQEGHLRQMAAALDQRIQPIAEALVGADDRHLLVIAGIALLDELAAAQSAVSESDTRESMRSEASQAAAPASVEGAAMPDARALQAEAANLRLMAANAALQAEVSALRRWADSMGGRLSDLSGSLAALAEDATED
jgi:cell division protein ZapA